MSSEAQEHSRATPSANLQNSNLEERQSYTGEWCPKSKLNHQMMLSAFTPTKSPLSSPLGSPIGTSPLCSPSAAAPSVIASSISFAQRFPLSNAYTSTQSSSSASSTLSSIPHQAHISQRSPHQSGGASTSQKQLDEHHPHLSSMSSPSGIGGSGSLGQHSIMSPSANVVSPPQFYMSEKRLRAEFKVKSHPCQHCHKAFANQHQLNQHLRVHTGERPYHCSYCERAFKQLSHLQQHTRLHTGEKPYKCTMQDCGRAFVQLSNLQQHLRNHDSQLAKNFAEKRPYRCMVCCKRFAQEASLDSHVQKEHQARMQPHPPQLQRNLPCTFCSHLFETENALFHHVRGDHKEQWEMFCRGRPLCDVVPEKHRDAFCCPICGKAYVNETCLRKHVSMHPEMVSTKTSSAAAVAAAAAAAIVAASNSSVRTWPCTICETVFPQEAGLLQHLRQKIHDDQHRFVAQYLLDNGVPLPPRPSFPTYQSTSLSHQERNEDNHLSGMSSLPSVSQ